jgi:hypothetical protein
MISRISSFAGPISLFPFTTGSIIVSTGLILNYDIGNASSYPGTGNTITDLQANSNASLLNTPTYTASPGYLTFNGSTQYLMTSTSLNSKLSPANTSKVISMFLWAYMTDNGVLVSEQGQTTLDGGWYDSQIERVAGTLRFSVWSNNPGFASTVATSLNTWYYIGFTYDGTTLRAYVNGSAAGTGTYARQSPYVDGGGAGLHYALAAGTGTNLGDGTYSNMRLGGFQVYNIALTAEQVLTNFQAGRSRYGV